MGGLCSKDDYTFEVAKSPSEIQVVPRTQEPVGGTRDPRAIIEGESPPPVSKRQQQEERARGGWKPPVNTAILTTESTSAKYVPPISNSYLAEGGGHKSLQTQAKEAALAERERSFLPPPAPNYQPDIEATTTSPSKGSCHKTNLQTSSPAHHPERQRSSVAPHHKPDTGTTASPSANHSPKNKNRHSAGLDAPMAAPKRVMSQSQTNNKHQQVQRRKNATFDEVYNRGRELGSGSFAKVFIGILKSGNQTNYAVKAIDRSKMKWSGRDALQDEINNLKKLSEAPHVVKFQDVFEEKNLCYLVLELLPGGELFARIIQKGQYSESEARESCRCILSALEYMHQRRVVHRDLKPENLLLAHPTNLGPVTLSDFGFSKTIEAKNGCRTLCGTPGYLAPEILERWPAYDISCDIWSFGVILFLLLGGYLPFDAHGSNDVNQVFERTRNGQYHFYPQRWKDISALAKDMVAKCLTVNSNKRIDAKAALKHEWMMAAGELKLPSAQLSIASLADTVKASEKAKEEKEKQRQQMKKTADNNRQQELEDDFTVFLENRQGDSIVSHMTGANKTVATQATHFKEDSPSGGLFSDFYKKGDKLGQGGFSTVYRCLHKRTSLSYAVKEVDIANLSGQEICTLQDEIVVLKFLRGAPFIIRLYDVFREANKTYMVLEEMKGGDVLHRICEKEVYTEREARDLCKILFHAVDYCHKKHIAHRDIKLDNLLLTEEGDDATIKLADFGFAKRVVGKNGLKTMCGTPNYMAPEVFDLKTDGYDFRCDMWSVGVVVFCLLGGYLPFEGTLQELHVLVTKGEYYFHEEYWKHITPSAKQMISSMLQLSPVVRYSAEQALACKWMGMDDEELSVMDLSDTQNKMRSMTSGKEKLKHVVRALIGVNKFASAAGLMKGLRKERPLMDSIEEEEQEEKFEEMFDVGEVVGDGIFASIHLATKKKTKEEFSVKRIVRKDLHPRDVVALNDEISALRAVAGCEYVIHLKEVYEDADHTYIVMERINGEPLIDRLITNKKLTEFDAKELARNLLLGIAHCHTKRIANRNLKLENLHLPAGGSERKLMICDFEFAKVVHFPNSLHTQCGTQEYVAPEVLENRPAYDVSCDIWTVGVIIFIMLGGYYPFRGKDELEVLKKVRYGEFVFHDKYWKGISGDAKSLIKSMMTVNPQQRITADDALGTAWIGADVTVLSADLSDNLQELKKYVKAKFKGMVKTIIATNKLQAIGEASSGLF